MEDKGPAKGLKGKEPLAEPLKKGEVPLSGNALFTFKLLTGGLNAGSTLKPVETPKDKKKSEDKPTHGTDVSQFEDRVMW
jgi:hypothetical protein